MSMIHAALQKAEEERKNREPYHLSVDAIVEMAKKKNKPETFSLKLPARSRFPVKGIFLALTGILILWLSSSLIGHWRSGHSVKPPVAPPAPKADGLKSRAAKSSDLPVPVKAQQPRPVQASPLENYVLTGVVTSAGRWSAMINGKLVEVGSTVYGAKVVSIYEGAATLEKNGKRFTVYLD